MRVKFLLKKIFIWASRVVFTILYDKRYLRGRWFDDSTQGWLWCWSGLWYQKILGFNRSVPWPCAPFLKITDVNNIHFHVDNIDNFQSSGCYFQNGSAPISIGRGTYIAPNVGIITSNHIIGELDKNTEGRRVVIGENCWIGMNCVLLPGVELPAGTIVGAGTVVTKSIVKERCLVAGVAGNVIKQYV